MTKTKEIQERGHCQCCGRQQAVMNGHMAHHGYTVDYGFFNGTCSGRDYRPMEVSRERTDQIVATLLDEANHHCIFACKLQAGSVDPDYVVVTRQELVTNSRGFRSWKEVPYDVPYCYGDEYEQTRARKNLIFKLEQLASQKRAFADMLTNLADKVHGKPLLKVGKDSKPAAIQVGERRMSQDGKLVMTCTRVEGPRVYYRWTKSDKVGQGWLGTRAWRARALAPAAKQEA